MFDGNGAIPFRLTAPAIRTSFPLVFLLETFTRNVSDAARYSPNAIAWYISSYDRDAIVDIE